MTEVEEVAAYWQGSARAARGEAEEEEVVDVGPREVSEAEWKRIAEAEQGFAETNFRRNPLA